MRRGKVDGHRHRPEIKMKLRIKAEAERERESGTMRGRPSKWPLTGAKSRRRASTRLGSGESIQKIVELKRVGRPVYRGRGSEILARISGCYDG